MMFENLPMDGLPPSSQVRDIPFPENSSSLIPPSIQPSIITIPEDTQSTTSPRRGTSFASTPPTSPLNLLDGSGSEKSLDTMKKLNLNGKLYLVSISIFFYADLFLVAKSRLRHDGHDWFYGSTRRSEKWAKKYCKKFGLIPSELRREWDISDVVLKRRPYSRALLEKLKEVVRQHLEGEEDFGVELDGEYVEWFESKESDFTSFAEERRVVRFGLAFNFRSYA